MPDELALLEQSVPAGEIRNVNGNGAGAGFDVSSFIYMASKADIVPPWYSASRDIALRKFWKRSDHLSGAIYNMVAKMLAIPWQINAKDTSIRAHQRQAAEYEEALRVNSQLLQGFENAYSPFLLDLLTQDNGAFMLVMAPGSISAPVSSRPYGLYHLDSSECLRTGDPEYPVVYRTRLGELFKIHFTRIIMAAQLPASERDMNGVGFCAVSRAISIVQHLIDINRYKQEKMGSRPPRLMLVGSGITAAQIYDAFRLAAEAGDNEMQALYSKIVAMGSPNQAKVELVDLARVPDGFNEKETVTLSMFIIALALGVDARELFPATASGATKADAATQHMKARGKGPGHIIQQVEHQINYKFLPPHLSIKFDYQDDEQDKAKADISDKRSIRRDRDLKNSIISTRVAREQMLADDELDKAQFAALELEDGRLEDGADILVLFTSVDPIIKSILSIGANIADVLANPTPDILTMIDQRYVVAQEIAYNSNREADKWKARQGLAALTKLRSMIKAGITSMAENPPNTAVMQVGQEQNPNEQPQQQESGDDDDEDEQVLQKSASSYRTSLRGLVRGLWANEIDRFTFTDNFVSAITRNFREAFVSGAKDVDIYEDEITEAEWNALEDRTNEEYLYVNGFADAIIAAQSKGLLRPLYDRVDLWINTYGHIREWAKSIVGADAKLEWGLGSREKHCPSCVLLAGRVYRASKWAEYDLYPGCMKLVCGPGHKCGCTFKPTTKRITPGPMPGL